MQLEEVNVMSFPSRPKGLLSVSHVAVTAAATGVLTGTLDVSVAVVSAAGNGKIHRCVRRELSYAFVYLFTSVC